MRIIVFILTVSVLVTVSTVDTLKDSIRIHGSSLQLLWLNRHVFTGTVFGGNLRQNSFWLHIYQKISNSVCHYLWKPPVPLHVVYAGSRSYFISPAHQRRWWCIYCDMPSGVLFMGCTCTIEDCILLFESVGSPPCLFNPPWLNRQKKVTFLRSDFHTCTMLCRHFQFPQSFHIWPNTVPLHIFISNEYFTALGWLLQFILGNIRPESMGPSPSFHVLSNS